jgi:hypothetical protein
MRVGVESFMPRSKVMQMATYKVLGGKHHVKGPDRKIRTYKKGETFRSHVDPRVSFPNKFELVSGQSPDDVMKGLVGGDSKVEEEVD